MNDAPTREPVLVPELAVRVVTGETCYAGEGGFSGVSAEVTAKDPEAVRALRVATHGGEVVLRCARLEVVGRLTKNEKVEGGERFVFIVSNLVYHALPSAHGG